MAQTAYCTQATVTGTYAVASQFMLPGPEGTSLTVPGASLAIVSITGDGAISGTSYSSMGGQISQSETPGTIKVNGDCTASVDWGQRMIAASVIIDEGKELRSILESTGPLGPAVVSATWKRISNAPATVEPNQCAPNAIVGTYDYRSSGFVTMAVTGASQPQLVPIAMLGLGSANEDGTAATTATASMGGQVMPLNFSSAGNIAIKPNCTATMTWDLSSQEKPMGQSQHFAAVFDGGDEIWGIQIQNSFGQPILLDRWSRISAVPRQPNRCTQEMVVGTYAFLYEGYVMMTPVDPAQAAPVPTAGLALASIDSQGVISSTVYQGIGGSPARTTMTGSIQVNSDCTGAVDWGAGVQGNLAVLREGEEMHSLMKAWLGPPIVSGRWKRISRVPNTVDPAPCSPGAVAGWYVNESHGFAMVSMPGSSRASAVPTAYVTAGSFTSNGAVLASGTGTFGGETSGITVNTRLTASSDCTFRLAHPNSPADVWGVVLDGGNELWGIALTAGRGEPVSTGTWRRTKTQP
jgi:hypothetical protein